MFSSRPVVGAGFDDGQPQGRVVLSLPGAGLHLRPTLQVAAAPMNSTIFQPAQVRRYFESRLPDFHFNGHSQVSVRCPFHDDGDPSFTINFDKGVWFCHAGCGGGGLISFEEKFSLCTHEQAKAAVSELLGMSFGSEQESGTPEATYFYHDQHRRLVFRKLRYKTADGGKTFVCEAPAANGKGWVKTLKDVPDKPLYRLPELIRASCVVVAEGEKKCDRLMSINLGELDPDTLAVTATCNFDGAGPGKWKPEYSPWFIGKAVVILPDNDEPGEAHALAIASAIFPYAASVRICHLPDLPEKGDICDYLTTHTPEDAVAEIRKAPLWQPDVVEVDDFTSMVELVSQGATAAEFVLGRHIERTGITALGAKIKCGKSSLAISGVRTNLEGTTFLGYPSLAGPVVTVTEMAGNAFLSALRRAGLQSQEGLWVMQPHQLFGKSWEKIVEVATRKCKAVGAVLLVIDTIAWAAGLSKDEENDAGVWREVYRPLQRAIGSGFGILTISHERKSGGSVEDGMRGSSAQGGCADIVVSLRKPEGNHRSETLRTVAAVGRFPETPSELTVDWTLDGEYTVIGNSDAVTRDRAVQKVLDALPFFADQAKTVLVLREETGESQTTIRRVLRELKAARSGTGPKGDPFKYHRAENRGSE
jgi:hypothetical protein